MPKSKAEMEQEISRIVAGFLRDQLGESASSITTYLSGSIFVIRASNCLAPAEQDLLQREKDWSLFQKMKAQQFERVESALRELIEKATGYEVPIVYSILERDGVRFVIATLGEDLEQRLLRKETVP